MVDDVGLRLMYTYFVPNFDLDIYIYIYDPFGRLNTLYFFIFLLYLNG